MKRYFYASLKINFQNAEKLSLKYFYSCQLFIIRKTHLIR